MKKQLTICLCTDDAYRDAINMLGGQVNSSVADQKIRLIIIHYAFNISSEQII
jgi:hypothetical protein